MDGHRWLVEAFDDYAEGHNYLGLIALDQDRLGEAIGHFRKTMEVGRRLFPKRLAKKHYWRQLATRPYMRGLRNLALILNRTGEYIEALGACEKLERECGDNATAAWYRAAIYLNTGRWEMALESSESLVRGISPDAGFIAGFAAIELGEREQAIGLSLYGALHRPRGVRMLAGMRTGKPTTHHEAEDHNASMYLRQSLHGYLANRKATGKRFLRQLAEHPAVISLLNEMGTLAGKWHEQKRRDRREEFDRLNEMRSAGFIKAQAYQIAVALQV